MARAFGSYPKCRWFKSDRRYQRFVQSCGVNNAPQIFGPLVKRPKTPPFHGGNRGSNPLWVTIKISIENYSFSIVYGRLAQLGEHLPYKQGVIGSSPIVPTIKRRVMV